MNISARGRPEQATTHQRRPIPAGIQRIFTRQRGTDTAFYCHAPICPPPGRAIAASAASVFISSMSKTGEARYQDSAVGRVERGARPANAPGDASEGDHA
ncbi:MAG: hypothetical protein B7Z80_00350 [Rhodospirillales bacterium 20-64-7]|nr:MAG: hypothetical protein B7Z80_00350 [Rhodospirillales bacterium 20-64-7]